MWYACVLTLRGGSSRILKRSSVRMRGGQMEHQCCGVRLLMAKCSPRKMRLLGIETHFVHCQPRQGFICRKLKPATYAYQGHNSCDTNQSASAIAKSQMKTAAECSPCKHTVLDSIQRDGVDDLVHAAQRRRPPVRSQHMLENSVQLTR